MKARKILIALTLLVTILLPLNVFASEIEPYAEGWQLVDTESYSMTADQDILSRTYTASDGNNFKLDVSGNGSSNVFTASMYINGVYYGNTQAVSYKDGNGSITFSGLNPGDRVQFLIRTYYSDYITIKFYD